MKRSSLFAACTLIATCYGGVAFAAAACPSETEVKAALTKYINVDYWTPAQRDIWKIKTVSGFTFGPMRTGQISKKQVEYGKLAQDVCPIRIEYAFGTESVAGEKKQTKMGENKTHLFYKDPFGDWIFKTE